MDKLKLLIIGDIFVDFHLPSCDVDQVSRLGGIIHSLWALKALGTDLDVQYYVAAVAPSYIYSTATELAKSLDAEEIQFLGEVVNAPNVVKISDSKEAGQQGYYDILGRDAEVQLDLDALENLLLRVQPTDVLIYPGKFKYEDVLNHVKRVSTRIHVDFQYGTKDFNYTEGIDTFIISTSSRYFIDRCKSDVKTLQNVALPLAGQIILKENRGGSRLCGQDKNWVYAPAYPTRTAHSVGVGDCYNAIAIALRANDVETRLRIAAYGASLYAGNWDQHNFVRDFEAAMGDPTSVVKMHGISMPWEKRMTKNIYLAAPDFPEVNTSLLDQVEKSLQYHNFKPRRPIKENGLIRRGDSESKKREVFSKDLELLAKSDLMVAVLLDDDAGTYVEIGRFVESKRPVILYDPNGIAENAFLCNSVSSICRSPGELIDTIFVLLGDTA